MPELKQEIRRLASQNADRSLMYPGEQVFTWLRIGSVWHLVSITQYR